MRGKKITLSSDRAGDTILPQALYTDSSGAISFALTSTTVGTSTLTTYVDGQAFATTTMSVLDAKTNDCSPNYSGEGY